jgi:hypothetical protein
MSETILKLAGKLAEAGDKTIEFFSSLPEGIWEMVVYSDEGMWKTHEALCHIAQMEAYYLHLLKGIKRGEDVLGSDFDLDRFNLESVSLVRNMGPDQMLDLFKQRRGETCSWLTNHLTHDDLELPDRHPLVGGSNMESIIKMLNIHVLSHQSEIQSLIRSTSDA